MKVIKIQVTLGVVLALALVAAIACGRDDEVATPVPAAPAAVAAPVAAAPAPAAKAATVARPAKPTGTLKMAWSTFGHNTMKVYQDGHWVAIPIFDPVMKKDENLDNIPGVVDSWNVNADFTSFSMKVREGVKFHDGSILDSEDLRESVGLWLRPETSGGTVRYLQAHMSPPTVVDSLTLQVDMDLPSPGFLKEMTTLSQPTLMIHAESLQQFGLENAFDKPIGTGPFTFGSFTASSNASFEAFPDYWGDGPYWERLEMALVSEDATRLALLFTGQTDVIDGSVLIAGALEKGKVKVLTTPPTVTIWGWFGNMYPPDAPGYTEDVPWFTAEARQAFNLAIDRQKLLTSIYRGYAIEMDTPVLGPGSTGYDQAKALITPYTFDPVRAKQLLASAGVAEGTEITIRYDAQSGGAPEMPAVVTAVAGMWEENLGLKVNTEAIESQTQMFPILAEQGDWPYIKFRRSGVGKFPRWDIRLLRIRSRPILLLPRGKDPRPDAHGLLQGAGLAQAGAEVW